MAKIIASLLFGLAVAGICVLSIWRTTGSHYYNATTLISWTQAEMRSVAFALETYYIDHEAFPPALTSLVGHLSNTDIPPDKWGRPLVYQVHYAEDGHSSYTLTSYGRDGKPGGRNRYERDIVFSNEADPTDDRDYGLSEDMPTLTQFVTMKYTHKGLWACVGAGVVAFLLSLRILPRDFQWKKRVNRETVVSLVCVLLVALFITFVLGWVHIPFSHS